MEKRDRFVSTPELEQRMRELMPEVLRLLAKTLFGVPDGTF